MGLVNGILRSSLSLSLSRCDCDSHDKQKKKGQSSHHDHVFVGFSLGLFAVKDGRVVRVLFIVCTSGQGGREGVNGRKGEGEFRVP